MGEHVPSGGANDAAELVRLLTERNETLATAESLTGGLLAATIVDVPGASVVLRGGLVVYATDLKATLAGVPTDLLDARGPVDPDVAVALARGARRRCGATWGVATTGVAGPTPQDGIPVGTVYIAVSGPPPVSGPTPGAAPRSGRESGESVDEVRSLRLDGDRPAIRRAAVGAALAMLAARLDANIGANGESATDVRPTPGGPAGGANQ